MYLVAVLIRANTAKTIRMRYRIKNPMRNSIPKNVDRIPQDDGCCGSLETWYRLTIVFVHLFAPSLYCLLYSEVTTLKFSRFSAVTAKQICCCCTCRIYITCHPLSAFLFTFIHCHSIYSSALVYPHCVIGCFCMRVYQHAHLCLYVSILMFLCPWLLTSPLGGTSVCMFVYAPLLLAVYGYICLCILLRK